MANEFARDNTYNLLVFVIICIGSFMRLYNFWIPPVWIDEYGTWWVVAADSWIGVIDRTLHIQGQSPFYYLLVKASAELVGYNAFALRIPSVAFGIFTLVTAYPFALKLFDDRNIGLLYLTMFAVSEPFIWYSQIARPYAVALFFAMVSLWSFLRLQTNESIPGRVIYVLSTALAIYAHYLFACVVIIQVTYMFIRSGYSWLMSRPWIVNLSILAIFLAPAIEHLINLHHRRHVLDWMASVDTSWKAASIIIYVIGGGSPVAILAAGFVVAVVGFRRDEFSFDDVRVKLTLPIVWYTVPLILFLIIPGVLGVTLIQPRYLLFGYPATYLLFAWLLFNVKSSGYPRWLPAITFLTITLLWVFPQALTSTHTFARWPNRAWNDALAKLGELYRYDGIIVAQVGLVEADLLAEPEHDSTLLSYLSWPIVSGLPKLNRENIAILPYRITPHTDRYLQSVVEKAEKHSQIWLVGGGEVLSIFQERIDRLGYTVRVQSEQGDGFHVIALLKQAQGRI